MTSDENSPNESNESEVLSAVPILRCTDRECRAWIREELASSTEECPICKGDMIRGMKHLPKLIKKYKAARR